MTNVTNEVLNKIKQQEIKPTPKYQFLLKRCVLWTLASVSVIVGALSIAVVFFNLFNQEWDVYDHVTDSLPIFFVLVLPYFWLVLSGIFLVVAYYNFHHTKFGYRWRFSVLVTGYLVLTLVLGGVFYRLGAGEHLENFFARNFKVYNQINYGRQIWASPQDGLIAGVIIDLTDGTMILKDLNNREWQIDISSTTISNKQIISVGQEIKVMGKMTGPDSCAAEEILPWCGCGGCGAAHICSGGCGMH